MSLKPGAVHTVATVPPDAVELPVSKKIDKSRIEVITQNFNFSKERRNQCQDQFTEMIRGVRGQFLFKSTPVPIKAVSAEQVEEPTAVQGGFFSPKRDRLRLELDSGKQSDDSAPEIAGLTGTPAAPPVGGRPVVAGATTAPAATAFTPPRSPSSSKTVPFYWSKRSSSDKKVTSHATPISHPRCARSTFA
jgi:hypothetical protein